MTTPRLRMIGAVVRHEYDVFARDPVPLVLMFLMPTVLSYFLSPIYRPYGAQPGDHPVGAVQSVPGMATTFAFFGIAVVGLSVFREHAWETWNRLLASSLHGAELIIGKMVIPLTLIVLQFVLLTAFGVIVLGMPMRGSWVAVVVMGIFFGATLTILGMMIANLAGTLAQVNMISNLCLVVLGALGGGLIPVAQLPGWAQPVAPLTPSYWAIKSLQETATGGAQWHELISACGVLAVYMLVFGTVSYIRLRRGSVKLL